MVSASAGTAFGVWLEGNTCTFVAIVTVVFIGGLTLAFRWLGQSASAEASRDMEPKQNRILK